ncbi:MAG: SMP-30/gluconolactonase/LRE family protein [Acidobacteria bacterium]|nr:SMP-30/gluconolactonase/LRE family protein [Acidobacteriota bacterium]
MRICITFVVLLALSVYAEERTPAQVSRDAKAAYDRKDYPVYLTEMRTLAALRPENPVVVANLGGAYALNGNTNDALVQLERLAAMRVVADLSDHDFDAVRDTPRFRAVLQKIEETRTKPIHSATRSIAIPQKDLLSEAIVWDAKARTFLVSGNRKGKIVRVDLQGHVSDFVTEGIFGANGLGIDAKRNLLWASSSPSPRFEGYTEKNDAEMALVAIDLGTGKIVRRIAPPEDGEKHFLDDLTVAPDGAVYSSDSMGSVLRVNGDKLETLVPRGVLRSPQGSALGGGTLYVSDYATGVWAVDPKSGKASKLEPPSDCTTAGIDGLEYFDGSLLAIQNGVEPNRLVRLRLNGKRITKCEVLEMNHPQMDEPTVGVVVGKDFWFLAASQGNKFDENKTELLHEGLILGVPLQ